MFSRFDTKHACDGQTDRQTELPCHISAIALYAVACINYVKLFSSELCQISTNCVYFWHKNGKEDKLKCGLHSFSFMSTHYSLNAYVPNCYITMYLQQTF